MSENAGSDPILNIRGELVGLGPVRHDLIPTYQRWMNDFATTRTLAIQPRPMTLEQESGWYEHASKDESEVTFTIFELSTGRAIGNCGMHETNLRNRRTEVGIVIGEPDARGKGYGTEAMRLLLDFAFTARQMHSVMLWTYEYNPAAIRAYSNVGFREIGRRRQSRWFNGRYWDEIGMDILAEEFASPVLRRELGPPPG